MNGRSIEIDVGIYTAKSRIWGENNIAVYLYRGKDMIYVNCHSDKAIETQEEAEELIREVEGKCQVE